MFRDYAELLNTYHDAICASFTTVTVQNIKTEETIVKRLSNGVSNFEYTRNRILWATRDNPSVLGIPKSRKEVYSEGKKRGPYHKNS